MKEKNISIKLSLNENCKFEYTNENDDYEDSFELLFELENSTSSFYFQCNKALSSEKMKGICNFKLDSYETKEKGVYKLKEYKYLFRSDFVNIELTSDSDLQFFYYQEDYINSVYNSIENYYVSEEGSGFLLFYFSYSTEQFVSNIYTNNETKKKIKNCQKIKIKEDHYIFCNISKEEIEYFDIENKKLPLI